MKKKIKIILVIVLLVVIFSIYLYCENTRLELTMYEILSEEIPENFNNYKIVQISDFHNTEEKNLTNDLVAEIKNQNPNIIVITGDLIDSRSTKIEVSIDFIEKIKDVAPIYYVNGNHESRIITDYNNLKNKLLELGVNILENKSTTITIGDSMINIIGVNDPTFAKKTFEKDSIILENEINNTTYNKENYTILLSHRPELFYTYVKQNMDLVFTGHAHGGQIRIPFLGGIISPNQGVFPKYTSGKFEGNNTTMIVNRGIGNSLFPFRINNRPELVVTVLKNK